MQPHELLFLAAVGLLFWKHRQMSAAPPLPPGPNTNAPAIGPEGQPYQDYGPPVSAAGGYVDQGPPIPDGYSPPGTSDRPAASTSQPSTNLKQGRGSDAPANGQNLWAGGDSTVDFTGGSA